jgi:hypothetical protein
LSDFDPDNVIDKGSKRRVCLSLRRGNDDALDPGGASQPGKLKWQRTVAGNQANGIKRQIHAIRVEISNSQWRIQP